MYVKCLTNTELREGSKKLNSVFSNQNKQLKSLNKTGTILVLPLKHCS